MRLMRFETVQCFEKGLRVLAVKKDTCGGGLVQTKHSFQYPPFAVGDHWGAASLSLDRYDTEILLSCEYETPCAPQIILQCSERLIAQQLNIRACAQLQSFPFRSFADNDEAAFRRLGEGVNNQVDAFVGHQP